MTVKQVQSTELLRNELIRLNDLAKTDYCNIDNAPKSPNDSKGKEVYDSLASAEYVILILVTYSSKKDDLKTEMFSIYLDMDIDSLCPICQCRMKPLLHIDVGKLYSQIKIKQTSQNAIACLDDISNMIYDYNFDNLDGQYVDVDDESIGKTRIIERVQLREIEQIDMMDGYPYIDNDTFELCHDDGIEVLPVYRDNQSPGIRMKNIESKKRSVKRKADRIIWSGMWDDMVCYTYDYDDDGKLIKVKNRLEFESRSQNKIILNRLLVENDLLPEPVTKPKVIHSNQSLVTSF